jgi:hypothetical protein
MWIPLQESPYQESRDENIYLLNLPLKEKEGQMLLPAFAKEIFIHLRSAGVKDWLYDAVAQSVAPPVIA